MQYNPESFNFLFVVTLLLLLIVASRYRPSEAVKPIWYQQLTKNERFLFYWLSLVEGKGQMDIIIQRVCSGDSVSDFRQLVSELKEQMRDCEKETSRLVGEQGAKYLKELIH